MAQAGAGQGAGGAGRPHPGCALEVLILLTPEERTRCRNELDALAARQKRAQEDRRYKARTSWIDLIPPEKRAFYEASMAARDAVRNGSGQAAGLSCNLGALFGGGGGPPGERIKVPGLPCIIKPPTGVLTEESRVSGP